MAVLRRVWRRPGVATMAAVRHSRAPTRRQRIAKVIMRIAKSAATDEDTYVFLGIAGLSLAAGSELGVAYGIGTGSGLMFAFGMWLGFWRLSAKRESDD